VGERNTVIALFADIKGSMELMEDLDPEKARAIVDPALKKPEPSLHWWRPIGPAISSTWTLIRIDCASATRKPLRNACPTSTPIVRPENPWMNKVRTVVAPPTSKGRKYSPPRS
jgi:hypothetical protein